HILAILHIAAIGLVFLVAGWRWLRSWLLLAFGGVVGAFPRLLWTRQNGWEWFQYVLPGGQAVGTLESGPGPLGRGARMVTDQWPVLLGYDSGYPPVVDGGPHSVAWTAVALAGG